MKYTAAQIRQMTWNEWNEAMTKELNDAGFRTHGFNSELGRWENNRELYRAPDDPKIFILGTVCGAMEYNHLKELGLLNNGRCPMCGKPIDGTPGRFTSGYDYNAHFQICQDCANKGRHTSINPVNKGCLLSLVMFPFYFVKGLL